MLLAVLFIERADPSKPGLKKPQSKMQFPFGRGTGLESGEQWGWFVGRRLQRDGCRVAEWWGSKAVHKLLCKKR